jgi:hypothetical protein
VIFSALMRVLRQGEEEEEVRHTGFETEATGEGSSPRCGHGSGCGSNFLWRKCLRRPEDDVEGLSGEVEGAWHAWSEDGLRRGKKRGGGSLGTTLVADGTRGKRGMGASGQRAAT